MMATVVAPRCRCGHTWPEHQAQFNGYTRPICLPNHSDERCPCCVFIPLRREVDDE